MNNLMPNNDDTYLIILELSSNGMDAGDKLIKFMRVSLSDKSNPTDKASPPTPDEQ